MTPEEQIKELTEERNNPATLPDRVAEIDAAILELQKLIELKK